MILAWNEAPRIAQAIASLPQGMQVLVIDHESTDETARIAAHAGAVVISRPFAGFVQARRFAVSQVRTPWTLMIDADEVLDAQLRAALLNAEQNVDGYEVQRSTYYRGKALRMWRGERLLRFFRTDAAHLGAFPVSGGISEVHERWSCPGEVRALPGALLHDSYPSHESYRRKFERYTAIEARGVRPSPLRFALEAARMPLRFVWYAFGRGAIVDGADGVRVAWWSANYPLAVQQKALRKTPLASRESE